MLGSRRADVGLVQKVIKWLSEGFPLVRIRGMRGMYGYYRRGAEWELGARDGPINLSADMFDTLEMLMRARKPIGHILLIIFAAVVYVARSNAKDADPRALTSRAGTSLPII